jgi:hypothetical protein
MHTYHTGRTAQIVGIGLLVVLGLLISDKMELSLAIGIGLALVEILNIGRQTIHMKSRSVPWWRSWARWVFSCAL